MFKVAKLVSSEMIIGDVKTEDGVHYFKESLQLALVPSPDGASVMIKMFPFNPFSMQEDVVAIKDDHVLAWIEKYPKNIKGEYDKIINPTRSSIIVPESLNMGEGAPKLKLI